MKNLKPNLKFLVFFLSFGLMFLYSCLCNCRDISNKTITQIGTYKDTNISVVPISLESKRFNYEVFENDTLSINEITIRIETLIKHFASCTSPNNHINGYDLFACSCVGPNVIDNTIRIQDTIIHLDITSLYNIGNRYKTNDLLNDSLFVSNPYNTNFKSDTTVSDLNQKGIFPRNEYFKIKTPITTITTLQFKIVATTKQGKTYEDTTALIYIKP